MSSPEVITGDTVSVALIDVNVAVRLAERDRQRMELLWPDNILAVDVLENPIGMATEQCALHSVAGFITEHNDAGVTSTPDVQLKLPPSLAMTHPLRKDFIFLMGANIFVEGSSPADPTHVFQVEIEEEILEWCTNGRTAHPLVGGAAHPRRRGHLRLLPT